MDSLELKFVDVKAQIRLLDLMYSEYIKSILPTLRNDSIYAKFVRIANGETIADLRKKKPKKQECDED